VLLNTIEKREAFGLKFGNIHDLVLHDFTIPCSKWSCDQFSTHPNRATSLCLPATVRIQTA
jgi:hypothetical protein